MANLPLVSGNAFTFYLLAMKFEIHKSRNSVQIMKFMQNIDQPLNSEECKYKIQWGSDKVQLMTNSVRFAHVHLVCNARDGMRGGAVGKCKRLNCIPCNIIWSGNGLKEVSKDLEIVVRGQWLNNYICGQLWATLGQAPHRSARSKNIVISRVNFAFAFEAAPVFFQKCSLVTTGWETFIDFANVRYWLHGRARAWLGQIFVALERSNEKFV